MQGFGTRPRSSSAFRPTNSGYRTIPAATQGSEEGEADVLHTWECGAARNIHRIRCAVAVMEYTAPAENGGVAGL